MKTIDLFIDAEWYPSGYVYLLGYAYGISSYSHIGGRRLTYDAVADIIAPVTGAVFFYGPDIKVVFRHSGLNIRNYRPVVNMLTVVRRELSGLPDYRLETVEHYLGLRRTTADVKHHSNLLSTPHRIPHTKLIRYNREDVLNLIRIKRKLRLNWETYYI